jgi:protein TonB
LKILLGETFEQEIMRVMKKMPKWNPGALNGARVSVYFKIPVVFEIPEEYRGEKQFHE